MPKPYSKWARPRPRLAYSVSKSRHSNSTRRGLQPPLRRYGPGRTQFTSRLTSCRAPNRTRILTSALRRAASNIFSTRDFVPAAGFMSYSPSYTERFRRAADYVDKILRGTKPGDIRVEQPTRFELVVNFITAKALGLNSVSLLATAPTRSLNEAARVYRRSRRRGGVADDGARPATSIASSRVRSRRTCRCRRHQVRAGDQPQDCEDARSRHAYVASRPRRRGD